MDSTMNVDNSKISNKQVAQWIATNSLYFSADNHSFFYGSHAGQGAFELRELPDLNNRTIETLKLDRRLNSCVVVEVISPSPQSNTSKFQGYFAACQRVIDLRLSSEDF